MTKAILIPVLVGSCAFYTCASAGVSAADGFVDSAQNFEFYSDTEYRNVHLHPDKISDREWSTNYYWSADDDATATIVLDEVHNNQYLEVSSPESPAEGVVRNFLGRPSYESAVTNAWTKRDGVNGYEGFYCQFKTKFALYDAELTPQVDSEDRLVIWSSKYPEGGENCPTGRLFITAGQFDGSVRNVKPYNYLIATTNIDPDAWHEVALRVIPDLQVGTHALGFEVWIDGNIALPGDDYPVIVGNCDKSLLTPEARLLISQRRLFPSLTAPGLNTSISLGGVAFTGGGMVDDFNFSTNAPFAGAKAARILTLRWDAGVTALKYQIGSESEVTVPTAKISEGRVEFEVPKEKESKITVNATYDMAGGYSQGFWGAEGSCSVVTNISGSTTNYWFKCDDSSGAGTAYVRSFRDQISLGGGVGSFGNFADAKEQAIAQGKILVMTADFAASRYSRDEGRIQIDRGETLTLDLAGYTIYNLTDEYPTIVNYGNLTIIDSGREDSGTGARVNGKILPYATFTGASPLTNHTETAVKNFASRQFQPTLVIRGGVYDGAINNYGEVTNTANGARMEGGLTIYRSADDSSCPQFISKGGDQFEFSDKLADNKLYYAYEEPYWKPMTNAFVWCGKGADDNWSTEANWLCNEVPGPTDLAIFPPSGTNVWEMDMEEGFTVGEIWFAGNVIVHGSNDFTNLKWTVPSAGRIRGDAILTWSGAVPPDLTTLLDDSWSGLVTISEVTSPKRLVNLSTWGTGSSTVRFSGVRGYYDSNSNVTVPYTLELVNGANGYGWKNDAGFTGSVVEFPVLAGSGSFISSPNTLPNLQCIAFRDISKYTGTLDVQGKRVVLGPGGVAAQDAGSITWSDGLEIKTGAIHNCRVAAFGLTMEVTGNYGDVLATYTDSTVGDDTEWVTLLPGHYDAELCVTNPLNQVKIAKWSDEWTIINGRRVRKSDPLEVNSQTLITSPLSQLSTLRSMSLASYYTPTYTADGRTVTVSFRLNELAVPVIGTNGNESAAITFKNDMASVIVSDIIAGFYYGLEYKATLSEEWPADPYYWQRAEITGGQIELFAPTQGPSGFYRVIVTDVDPNGEVAK